MTNYSNWYPLSDGHIEDYLKTRKDLVSTNVKSTNTGVVISVLSDSTELINFCNRYLNIVNYIPKPDYSLAYLLRTPILFPTPRGLDHLKRYESNCIYNDAGVDFKSRKVLYAGVRHFGLLKSLISGLQSFAISNDNRQGLHAAALELNGIGVLIVGGAESGKTNSTLRLLLDGGRISSEDWCDVIIDSEKSIKAIGIDTNISFDIKDLQKLISKNLLDSNILNMENVPHGHRYKTIAELDKIYSSRVVPELSVNKIFLMSDVNEAKEIESPDPKWIYDQLSAVSLHNPFCFPLNPNRMFSMWKFLGDKNIQNAKHKMAERYIFALNLSKRISEKLCTIILIPKNRDISFEKKVSMIQKFLRN